MKEEKELNFIADAFAQWLTKIMCKKALGLNDVSIISEDVSQQILNLIYGLELKNLNLTEAKRVDGIDLGDEKSGIAFQISTSVSRSKIEKNLKTFVSRGLSSAYPNGIRFLILNHHSIKHAGNNYKKIYKGFDKDKHIITHKELLKEVRRLYTDDKTRFDKIKKVLEQEIMNKPETSEKQTEIEVVAYHLPLSVEAKMKILKEKNEYENDIRSYFRNPSQVSSDFKQEVGKIIPLIEEIIEEYTKAKTYCYRSSHPSEFITVIEHETKFALRFRWYNTSLFWSNNDFSEALFLECGIYKAETYNPNRFSEEEHPLEPVQVMKYRFVLGKSRRPGWSEDGREDDFSSTEEIVSTWNNQFLNRLVF